MTGPEARKAEAIQKHVAGQIKAAESDYRHLVANGMRDKLIADERVVIDKMQ